MRHHHQEGQPQERRETRPQPASWLTDQHPGNLQVLHSRLQELASRYQLPVPALARILHVSPTWVAAALDRLSPTKSSEVDPHV